MKTSRHVLLAAALVFGALPRLAPAQIVVTKLGDFNVENGQFPASAVTFGTDGNLYGTTPTGGSTTVNPPSQGCVYTVSPNGGNLHRFASFYDTRALAPFAPLIVGSDGNFYGTASGGSVPGPNNATDYSYGSIFRLRLDGTVTLLYNFARDNTIPNYPHGLSPQGPLLEINPGVFLGTTAAGGDDHNGTQAVGTVFQFDMNSGVLNTFTFFGQGRDGNYDPKARLVAGGDGYYYSTSHSGGPSLLGTIFHYSPGIYNAVYDFNNQDGTLPEGGLTLGPDGKLYGVTEAGGTSNLGTYYRYSAAGGYELLGTFNGAGNGSQPFGEMVLASDGNFYGTTSAGGSSGFGTVFKLTVAGDLTTIYTFPVGDGHGPMGYAPKGTLVQGPDGRLYGTAQSGGSSGSVGTVFALSLNDNHPAFFIGEVPLSNGVYYLGLRNGAPFGYYSYLSDPHYIYHQDLGFEYLFEAGDSHGGVYFYDFQSGGFFYTSPSFGFPYLYDFNLDSVVYYYPDPNSDGRYNTNGVRYFYVFRTGQIISK